MAEALVTFEENHDHWSSSVVCIVHREAHGNVADEIIEVTEGG